jgi:hypothetical protein
MKSTKREVRHSTPPSIASYQLRTSIYDDIDVLDTDEDEILHKADILDTDEDLVMEIACRGRRESLGVKREA